MNGGNTNKIITKRRRDIAIGHTRHSARYEFNRQILPTDKIEGQYMHSPPYILKDKSYVNCKDPYDLSLFETIKLQDYNSHSPNICFKNYEYPYKYNQEYIRQQFRDTSNNFKEYLDIRTLQPTYPKPQENRQISSNKFNNINTNNYSIEYLLKQFVEGTGEYSKAFKSCLIDKILKESMHSQDLHKPLISYYSKMFKKAKFISLIYGYIYFKRLGNYFLNDIKSTLFTFLVCVTIANKYQDDYITLNTKMINCLNISITRFNLLEARIMKELDYVLKVETVEIMKLLNMEKLLKNINII